MSSHWLFSSVSVGLFASVGLALGYLFKVEIPRAQKLLAEIREQHQTRHIAAHYDQDEEDRTMDQANEEIEGQQGQTDHLFVMDTETLEVEYTENGVKQLRKGTAEVLSIQGQTNKPQLPLFLIIPGNPGLVGFYRLFMLYLHRLCQGKVEFRCISYVGHTGASLNQNRSFTFQYQLAFFRSYLKKLIRQHPGRKIFLSGHSVGAYVCLQLLDSLTPEEVANIIPQTFLLFPTVFEIGSTPNGVIHTPILNYFRPLILSLVGALSFLPRSIKNYILFHHVGLNPFEVETAHHCFQVHTVKNCLLMAKHEMAEIGPLQVELVRRHLPRLYWIWGHTDQWAPLTQLATLKSTFPTDDLHTELADPTVAHAFVVGGSHLVAPMVYERLRPFL